MEVFLILTALLAITSSAAGLQCWQCAAVEGKRCPEDAKMVESNSHDACITWRLGNGTVLLQNVVVFRSECTVDKINFWTKFINLYYRSTGGEVRCCDSEGCNTGAFSDSSNLLPPSQSEIVSQTPSASVPDDFGLGLQAIGSSSSNGGVPGAPLIFGAVSSAPPLFNVPSPTQAPTRTNNMMPSPVQQQQLASLMSGLGGAGLNTLPMATGFPQLSPQASAMQQQQQLLAAMQQQLTLQQQQQLASAFLPSNGLNNLGGLQRQQQQSSVLPGASIGTSNPNSAAAVGANGNCQRYFPKRGNGEWLPSTLMPLSFDRASETKVGVFYVRFTADNGNNDHIIVRLVGEDRSNRTMYSIKLYRVGSVSIFISQLENNNRGEEEQEEIRRDTVQDAVNLTDTTLYKGFWFTVKDEEIALGHIGDQLIDPVIIWNDTRREGPRNVAYFALTTDQSQASFGVNCDVPNLHFEDTCVTDEDCKEFPNTVCSNEPINRGLDPGTRRRPFDEWEERDTLLKSCFCKQGHVRIPQSDGCYDPIRNVVTLRDACFADYHCEHLPNTHCAPDRRVLTYNNSCQCIPGNKPFDRDPRTGLIEGCAPLTEADRSTVLGCGDRIEVDDEFAWFPRNHLFELQRDSLRDVQYGVFFIKLVPQGSRDDVAIIRLIDDNRNPRKMYSIKFFRISGKISICESLRSRSFFFESERDAEKVAINELDVSTRMQLDYVGFWLMYKYEDGVGGTLSVGLNGSPFSQEYALARWTDRSATAIDKLKYIGFTGTEGSNIKYGVNCVLLDTPLNNVNAGRIGTASSSPSVSTLGGLGQGFSGMPNALSGLSQSMLQASFGSQLPNTGTLQSLQNQAAMTAAIRQLQLRQKQQQQQQQQQQLLQALRNQKQQQQPLQATVSTSGTLNTVNPWATLMQQRIAGSGDPAATLNSMMGRHSAPDAGGVGLLAAGSDNAGDVDLDEIVAPMASADLTASEDRELDVITGDDVDVEGSDSQRDQYLTKLKRLLPSFFEGEYDDDDSASVRSNDAMTADGDDYADELVVHGQHGFGVELSEK